MEEKELATKVRYESMGLSDEELKELGVFESETEEPCFICKSKTKYIDFCSEMHICSGECLKQFNRYVSELEERG